MKNEYERMWKELILGNLSMTTKRNISQNNFYLAWDSKPAPPEFKVIKAHNLIKE
jgi:hypothetical protein